MPVYALGANAPKCILDALATSGCVPGSSGPRDAALAVLQSNAAVARLRSEAWRWRERKKIGTFDKLSFSSVCVQIKASVGHPDWAPGSLRTPGTIGCQAEGDRARRRSERSQAAIFRVCAGGRSGRQGRGGREEIGKKSEGRVASRAERARRPRTQGRNNGRKGEDGGMNGRGVERCGEVAAVQIRVPQGKRL